ncbi:MAG: 3'-5' exonuclease, partial [Pseudomonadota bacterium]
PDTTAGPKAVGKSLLSIDGLPVWAPSKGDDSQRMAREREREAERSLSEERRLLYVALTRAEDRLIIGGAWRAREKETGYHPQSWYAICRGGLEHLGVEGLNDTEAQIWGQAPEYSETTITQTSTRETDVPAWLYAPAPADAGALPTLSPSQLFTEQASMIDPLTAPGPDRRLRGRVIHTLLERLPSLPEAEREETARLYLSRIDTLSKNVCDEILETTLKTLGSPDLAKVFGRNSRAEVEIVGEGTGDLTGRTLA